MARRIVTTSTTYPPPMSEILRGASMGDGKAHVVAAFDDGTTSEVLAYYSDELSFSEAELVGKTEEEVHDLFRRKDEAYLRS